MKITVLGAGTWGTALTILLAENKHEVTIWSALEREVLELKEHRNAIKNLPGAYLPESVTVTLFVPSLNVTVSEAAPTGSFELNPTIAVTLPRAGMVELLSVTK